MNLIKKLSTRSPRPFRINAGSCNGCDVELATTACISRYDVERLGCEYCGSPRHADIVLDRTGPLTARVKDKVLRVWNEIPEPKVTVAVGICPISGGVFREGYSIEGPVDRDPPIDVNVPGCPPAARRRSWKACSKPSPSGGKGWRARYGIPQNPLGQPQEGPGDRRLPLRRKRVPPPTARAGGSKSTRRCAWVAARASTSCAAGAINISKFEDGSGFEITVWRNSWLACAPSAATTARPRPSPSPTTGRAPTGPRKNIPRSPAPRSNTTTVPYAGPKCAFCRRKCSTASTPSIPKSTWT